LGAAVAAVAVAGGLAYGGLGGSSARLSGADTRLVPVTEAPASPGTGRPVPQPDSSPAAPSPRSQAKRHIIASPATGAGAADAVAVGKQVTGAPHAGRMIMAQSQGAHRTVTVSAPPTASSTPAGSHTKPALARLTVRPASLSLGDGSFGQITLSAAGGSVSWTASATGVSVSPASGQLTAGHSATVTVSVQRRNGSGGSATVQINGVQVPVTWAATGTASEAPSGGFAPSGGPVPAAPPTPRHHRQPSGESSGAAFS
jgi:VCBS repeat-containing protein